MFNWFRTLSAGNKIAFGLSGCILAASLCYSTASTFVAGSNAMSQPVFPNIISSSLPQPTAVTSPTPTPTPVAAASPAASPILTPTPSLAAKPDNPSNHAPQAVPKNNNSSPNKSGHNKSQQNDAVSIPAGAAAFCRDGSYSFSLTQQGACQHHGGVAKWLQGSSSNQD